MGILVAIAVPKYQKLAINAEINQNFKVLFDTVSLMPSVYVNLVDMEKKDLASLELSDLISFQGSQWKLWRSGIIMIRSLKNAINLDYGIMSIWYEDMTK